MGGSEFHGVLSHVPNFQACYIFIWVWPSILLGQIGGQDGIFHSIRFHLDLKHTHLYASPISCLNTTSMRGYISTFSQSFTGIISKDKKINDSQIKGSQIACWPKTVGCQLNEKRYFNNSNWLWQWQRASEVKQTDTSGREIRFRKCRIYLGNSGRSTALRGIRRHILILTQPGCPSWPNKPSLLLLL